MTPPPRRLTRSLWTTRERGGCRGLCQTIPGVGGQLLRGMREPGGCRGWRPTSLLLRGRPRGRATTALRRRPAILTRKACMSTSPTCMRAARCERHLPGSVPHVRTCFFARRREVIGPLFVLRCHVFLPERGSCDDWSDRIAIEQRTSAATNVSARGLQCGRSQGPGPKHRRQVDQVCESRDRADLCLRCLVGSGLTMVPVARYM
mmetsp:Transcript_97703/g.271843  ORF Transcript_97703/g.271843 Transcript_97703/m.271843 type:complete len:205 (-) Transcript_97703:371-985(-)